VLSFPIDAGEVSLSKLSPAL